MSIRRAHAFRRLIVLFAGLVSAALAAPQLTTIEDTLYKADGSRFNGLLIISWKTFEAADSASIAAHVKTVRVTDGYLKVQLAPSSTAIPVFTYSVRYNSDGKVQFDETWLVPPSPRAVKVKDVRTTGSVNGGSSAGALQEADITGLAEDLLARPTKGSGYTPGVVAWINAEGSIEGVTGSPSDCVHVDGSAAPCASSASSTSVTFVDGETPGGSADGSNRTFTLVQAPSPAASLMLFRNGSLQKPGQDFTLSGTAITFAAAATPQTGDILDANYRLNPTTGTPLFADAETPTGLVDGSNATFAIAHTPSPVSSLRVFRNGLQMKSGLDYNASGQGIVFISTEKPQSGDTLLVFYRY